MMRLRGEFVARIDGFPQDPVATLSFYAGKELHVLRQSNLIS